MKLSIKGPKVKGLSTKNIGKQLGQAIKSGSKIVESGLKSSGKLATGDFKGAGKSAMQGFSSVSDLAGQAGGNVGSIFGQKKTGNMLGRIGGEIGANLATGGGYGLAKTATQSLAGDGLKGLLKGDMLQDAALGSVGSAVGLDPSILKAGLAATKGDIKGAALQGLGSMGGLDPQTMQYASTGVSALTGDKKGVVKGIASQFGASDNIANMLGSAVTGDKKGLASNLASQFGADKNIARMIGSAAGGDKSGLASGLASEFGAGEEMSGIAGKFASGKTAEEIAMEKALRTGRGVASSQAEELGLDNMSDLKKLQDQFKNVNVKSLPGAVLGNRDKNLKQWRDDAATYIPGQPLGEEKWTMDRVLGNLKREGGKALDQIKSGASSARDFAAENKNALGLAAQGAAAYGGYRAGEKGRDAATGIQKAQLSQVQGAGREFEGMDYDPNRYAREQQFLQERITGGGVTAQERQMQSEGDIRASRMAAAQRLGGLETQARLGGAGLGTAALAGALTGSQGEQNIQQQTNLARETSASDRLERDIQRTGALSTQQTMEEANLAQAQGQFGLNKAAQAGITRANLGDLEMARANALQNLYGRGADLATAGLNTMKSREDLQREEQAMAYQKQQQDLENRKKEAEINALNRQGSVPAAGTTTPTIQKQTTPPPAQKPPVQKPPVQNVNAGAQTPTTNKLNQTYSGPMARPINNAMDNAAKAKELYDKFNFSGKK
jgi:hypothetical protein